MINKLNLSIYIYILIFSIKESKAQVYTNVYNYLQVNSTNFDDFTTNVIGIKYYRLKYLLQQYTDLNLTASIRFYTSGIPYAHEDNLFFVPTQTFNTSGTANGHFIASSVCDGITATNPYRMIKQPQETKSIVNNEQYNVYPNPTNGELQVELRTSDYDHKIAVYNLAGEIVYNNNVPNNLSKLSINTSNLPSGIYKLIISSGDKLVSKSITVSH